MSHARIFLSYRRDDAGAEAHAIRLAIREQLGDSALFVDSVSLQPGDVWPVELRLALDQADTVLVIIGPDWLRAGLNEWGERRIDRDNDWVRQELAIALASSKRVIPVLVRGASMPPPHVLPTPVQGICERQRIEVRRDYWDHDLQFLIAQLQPSAKSMPRPTPALQRRDVSADPNTIDDDADDHRATTAGIWARVKIHVNIECYDDKTDRIDGVVTISATNNTQVDLPLREAYQLPVPDVFFAQAYVGEFTEAIKQEDFLLTKSRDADVLVYFDNRTLRAGETFTWTIKYSRMVELYMAGILSYDLKIDPQNEFQRVPVQKHDFDVSVNLMVPHNTRWRSLKQWQIRQRNTVGLNASVQHKRNESTCVYGSFQLGREQRFRMRMACIYEYRSSLRKALVYAIAAATVVVIEHAPALIMKLLAP